MEKKKKNQVHQMVLVASSTDEMEGDSLDSLPHRHQHKSVEHQGKQCSFQPEIYPTLKTLVPTTLQSQKYSGEWHFRDNEKFLGLTCEL